MKEHPINLKAQEVRAILKGRKTQLRRFVLPHSIEQARCPFGQVGDRLWVREPWRAGRGYDGMAPSCMPQFAKTWFLADIEHDQRDHIGRTRPATHLPRWASRILLEITGVRVERLQDISESDALDEGITFEEVIVGAYCDGVGHCEEWGGRYFFDDGFDEGYEDYVDAYAEMWSKINDIKTWGENPWVWVIEFDVLECAK